MHKIAFLFHAIDIMSGWGIFAVSKFDPKEVIFKAICLAELQTRTNHSIQKDFNKHVLMDLPGRLINHSCVANVGIADNAAGAYDFVSLKTIQADDELTWASFLQGTMLKRNTIFINIKY